MVRRNRTRLVLAGAVLAVFSAVGISVCARDLGATGIAWQIPGSGIDVERVYSFQASNGGPYGGYWTNDCVTFVNTGPDAVAGVEFLFTLADAQGNHISPLVFDLRQTIPKDVVMSDTYATCRTYGYAEERGKQLVGWVNAVFFANQKQWRLVPPVQGSVESSIDSGVTLSNAVTYLPPEECVDFTNTSERNITSLRIVFEHVDTSGAELSEDALDVKRPIASGQRMSGNCRTFQATSQPDIFAYGAASARGETQPGTPTILVHDRASQLVTRVDQVTFADGTSWRATP